MSEWTFEWNDEAIERLRKLRAAGFSTSHIAAQFGVSKNAVVGKLYRLKTVAGHVRVARTKHQAKLQPRPKQPKQKQGADKWFKMEPPPPPPKPQSNVPFTRSLIELGPRQCKWPQGDRDFVFCGEPQEALSPYCAEHTVLAYNPKARQTLSAHYIRTTQG